jgi:uncharacterized phage protein (TIGR01671 family)
MNRPIKFRVWDKQFKCWVGRFSHDWVGTGIGNVGGLDIQPWKCMSFEGQIMSNDNMGGFVDSNQQDYIIQQFIGLLDGNGKEIYEGDVVEFDETSIGGYKGIGEVEYVTDMTLYGPCYCLWVIKSEVKDENQSDTGFMRFPFNVKVIGNIFKNI